MIDFEAPNEETLSALREKHGELVEIVDSDTGRTFVLAKPQNPRATLQRFFATAANDAKRLDALDALARVSLVHPDKDTVKRVLEDEPGLAGSLGQAALKLLGVRELEAKKG